MSSIKHGIQYAKIIAIVDNATGEVKYYDWTITENNHDYFADPEDWWKYFALTVKNLRCDSLSEVKAKFEEASQYLNCDFLGIKDMVKKGKGFPFESPQSLSKQIQDINKTGFVDRIWPCSRLFFKFIRASPLAHGEEEVHGEEDMRVINNSEMMAMDYKPHDRVLVCESHLNQWLTIVACHETDDDTVIIGRDSKDDELVQFRSKHVLAYRTAKADLSLKMRRFQAKLKKQLKKEQRNRQ